jgi:hypothetical protein
MVVRYLAKTFSRDLAGVNLKRGERRTKMSKVNVKSAFFEDVVDSCKLHFSKMRTKDRYAQIRGLLPDHLEKGSHFEILKNDKSKILSVEFHIEEDDDETKILQTIIKCFEDICVIDKKIEYDPKWYEKGRLRIKCSYSDGVEKIQDYINEFICQVKSRIEILTEMVK